MNRLNIYLKNLVALNSFVLLLIFVSSSCSKKSDDNQSIGEKVDLIVKVAGVKDVTTELNLKASGAGNSTISLPSLDTSFKHTFAKNDLVWKVESHQIINSDGFKSNIDNGIKTKASLSAATSPMDTGVKYRLLLYSSSNELIASVETTVGQEQHFSVTSGETYKWYAYSYNTSASIPSPNSASPTITTPINTPLLYASGQISPTTYGTILPITFQHQLTQLRVEIKESSGFRAILGATGEFTNNNYVQTSTFDILTGQKTGALISANISTLSFMSEVNADTVKQVAKYYTANDAISSYSVNINSLNVQYTKTSTRSLVSTNLPNTGVQNFIFSSTPTNKRGYVLKGTLQLSFVLPTMTILPFSNSSDNNGYRFGTGTAAGAFLRAAANFGPSSDYVRIKSLTVIAPTTANEATTGTTGWNRFIALMNDPAKYPDILVVANWFNYLNDQCWDLINDYINAGGNVFYTHDEPGGELYAARGIGNIFGVTGLGLNRPSESSHTYRFTDTQNAENDGILRGPFGDVRPYYWGQDRVGTTYITGYNGSEAIVYSNRSQNATPPATPGMAFFRHKTKSFFYVGDVGFYNNNSLTETSTTQFPFRVNASYFPVLAPYSSSNNLIANSFMFGNVMSWMLNRAHYNPIDRTGPIK